LKRASLVPADTRSGKTLADRLLGARRAARARAGQPLPSFLHERLFEPLGMRDTGFSVPPAEQGRLASAYELDPGTGALALYDGVRDSSDPGPGFPLAHRPRLLDRRLSGARRLSG